MFRLRDDQPLTVETVANQDTGGLLPEIGTASMAACTVVKSPVPSCATTQSKPFCRSVLPVGKIFSRKADIPDGGEMPWVEMPEGVGSLVEGVHFVVDPQAVRAVGYVRASVVEAGDGAVDEAYRCAALV